MYEAIEKNRTTEALHIEMGVGVQYKMTSNTKGQLL